MNFKIWISVVISIFLLMACKKNKDVVSTMENQKSQAIENLIVNPLEVSRDFRKPDSNDPFTILSATMMSDSLIIEVQYGGGCQMHEFSLFSNGMYAKTLPMEVDLFLQHKANNDMCRALLTRRLAFDVSVLKKENIKSLNLIVNEDRNSKILFQF